MSRSQVECRAARARFFAQAPLLERLLYEAPYGVVIHLDSQILYANPAAARMLGAASGDALLAVDGRQFVAPASAPQVAARMTQVAPGAPTPPAVHTLIRGDGAGRLCVEASSFAIPTPDGSCIMTVADDVSARLRLEASLTRERASLHLARRLGEVAEVRIDLVRGVVEHDPPPPWHPTAPPISELTEFSATLLERCHPDDRPSLRAALDALPRAAIVTFRCHQDDRVETFELHLALDEAAATVVGTIRTVSAQRRADDAERAFHTLVDGFPDAVIAVDGAGRIHFANPAAAVLLGYTLDELRGLDVEALVAPADRDAHVARRAGFVAAGGARLMANAREVMVVRHDGSQVAVEIGLGPSTIDGRAMVIATLRDVSARRAARQQLEASEASYRALFELAPDGIFTCDADGRYTSVNDAGCRMLGYTRAEILARSVSDLRIGPARPPAEEVGPGFHAEPRLMRHASGAVVPCELSTVPLPDGSFQGILRDVGERRRVEEAAARARRLDALSRMAGGVAHDFNNLLTVILNVVDELDGRLRDRPELAELVAEVRDAGQRGADLTRQLLAFARAQPTQQVRIDLSAVVREFARLLVRMVGPDVRIALELAASLPAVLCDRKHVEQIVMNLVLNARDAMPRGGTITVRTSAGADVVTLAVIDDGAGMSPDVLAHLFEPFYTTKPDGRGTGLGLATVHGLVSGAGGTITVESELGRGTLFEIRLPTVPVD